VKIAALAVAGAVGLLLIVLFARALPDFAERARSGEKRSGEAACEALGASPSNPAFASFPTRAPDFTLKNVEGHEVKLSSYRGNVVLLNFWATWCGTCVVEMPSMEKLVGKMRGKPFRLLAVSVDDDWAAVQKFFKKGTSLDVVLDQSRDVPKRYGTEKFPESFIIDKDGNIRYFVVSDRDWSQPAVAACLDSLMDG
jgi:peroxiredoxin